MIAAERHRLADLVESLSPAQLAAPTLCAQWNAQQVVAHLVVAVSGPRSLLLELLRTGGNLHQANARAAMRMAERGPTVLAGLLRQNAENPFRPPVVGYPGQLTDLQVHRQDIRRPLGLPYDLLPDRLRVSLDFLVSGRAAGFLPRKRTEGLRFEASDLPWAWGTGPVVQGPAEALMMGLTGRAVALAELSGEGLPTLRARLR